MKTFSRAMMLMICSTLIFSFSANRGGEGFEISLNNKVMIQQYGANLSEVKELPIDENAAAGQLTIRYHHCGETGKNRVVSIRDAQNKTLKEWHYKDAGTYMNCNVKDIVGLAKDGKASLKLYYTSSLLPEGRLLTNIVVNDSRTAKK